MATQALTHAFLVGLLKASPHFLFPKQKYIFSFPLFEDFMWLIKVYCHKRALAVLAQDIATDRISPIYASTMLLGYGYRALSLVLQVWKVKENREKW